MRVRRRLSVAKRTIKRWVRWDINRRRQIIGAKGRAARTEGNIAGGLGGPIFGLQDQCY